MKAPSKVLVSLVLILFCLKPSSTELIVNLPDLRCKAKIIMGGCSGVTDWQPATLLPPFDQTPGFCSESCVAEVESAPECHNSNIRAIISESCGLLKCLGLVYENCSGDPCSGACGGAILSPFCEGHGEQLVARNLSVEHIGPQSTGCLRLQCVQNVAKVCGTNEGSGATSKLCSRECEAAVRSRECRATEDAVPESLSSAAGPYSIVCRTRSCMKSLEEACGSFEAIPSAETQYCSPPCAEAFQSSTCEGTELVAFAHRYGPGGLLCKWQSDVCLQGLMTACGDFRLVAHNGTAPAQTLPQVCTDRCRSWLESEACSGRNTSAIRAITGPESPFCQGLQCLEGAKDVCNIDTRSNGAVVLRDAGAICSPECGDTLDAPSCEMLRGARATLCGCIPILREACGYNASIRWSDAVNSSRLCSDGCREALAGAGCSDVMPKALAGAHGYLCSCGASLVESCTPLSQAPFSEGCCQAATAPACMLPAGSSAPHEAQGGLPLEGHAAISMLLSPTGYFDGLLLRDDTEGQALREDAARIAQRCVSQGMAGHADMSRSKEGTQAAQVRSSPGDGSSAGRWLAAWRGLAAVAAVWVLAAA
uniref:Uncharacterized protein n=1 Tax=Tetraselmis sp. GSL018 TaxID=582737 RepID=A0A061RHN7_9CHLO|eukprot:CAMPEP_0177627610 /NCGR_PEP_ID=MMETSP0419_2-20121207/31298_1 /TAXON_ID=582737 /ORGANISM="Tetraselmis sp., Strain GSL018" /LENGTH=593 /DNA_ID=CAMNT_0019128781 /DNA_START=68 /DNA_END=1849 /DNA_ORIENTATION=-